MFIFCFCFALIALREPRGLGSCVDSSYRKCYWDREKCEQTAQIVVNWIKISIHAAFKIYTNIYIYIGTRNENQINYAISAWGRQYAICIRRTGIIQEWTKNMWMGGECDLWLRHEIMTTLTTICSYRIGPWVPLGDLISFNLLLFIYFSLFIPFQNQQSFTWPTVVTVFVLAIGCVFFAARWAIITMNNRILT